MQSTFTQKDLILYLYRETSPKQSAEIEEALETDWELREKFTSLADVVRILNETCKEPHPTLDRQILHLARKKSQARKIA